MDPAGGGRASLIGIANVRGAVARRETLDPRVIDERVGKALGVLTYLIAAGRVLSVAETVPMAEGSIAPWLWQRRRPSPKAQQGCQDGGVDVLSSRILLRPADLGRSRRFYRDVLGLAVYREFGAAADPGVVFFLGPGLLEVSGSSASPPGGSVMIWLQVRDVHAEHERLAAAGVRVLRGPAIEPWGLIEMWIEDPDGVRIVLVEVPAAHPLRRDLRSLSPAT